MNGAFLSLKTVFILTNSADPDAMRGFSVVASLFAHTCAGIQNEKGQKILHSICI